MSSSGDDERLVSGCVGGGSNGGELTGTLSLRAVLLGTVRGYPNLGRHSLSSVDPDAVLYISDC
jgi:hypothetical protein